MEPMMADDIEVFHNPDDYQLQKDDEGNSYSPGWYWWYCMPGCLPSSEPTGPYLTEEAAIKGAQENAVFEEDSDES